MITGLSRDWEKQMLQSWRHKQNLTCAKTQRKEAVIPQATEPKLPAGVEGSSVEVWVSRGSPQGQGYWKVPLGINTLGVHH